MTLLTDPTSVKPSEWTDAPDGKLYELIDGKPVEKRVSFYSLWIATEIARRISNWVVDKNLGYVATEAPVYGVFGRPNHGRRPDVCFISRTALPVLPTTGDLQAVPELVVEVVSPHDNVEEFETKLAEYLAAGVKLIWVVYPQPKLVRVHRADGNSRLLNITGTLDGEIVLPGFTCGVADIFPKT